MLLMIGAAHHGGHVLRPVQPCHLRILVGELHRVRDAQVVDQLHEVHAAGRVQQAVHEQHRILVPLAELRERLELLAPALAGRGLVLVRRHDRDDERVLRDLQHLPGQRPLVGRQRLEHRRVHRVRHVDRLQPGLGQQPLAVAGHRDRLSTGHLEEVQVGRRHRVRLDRRPHRCGELAQRRRVDRPRVIEGQHEARAVAEHPARVGGEHVVGVRAHPGRQDQGAVPVQRPAVEAVHRRDDNLVAKLG
jgi:hypothetical protein